MQQVNYSRRDTDWTKQAGFSPSFSSDILHWVMTSHTLATEPECEDEASFMTIK